MVRFNHAPPHLPPQGFSFFSQNELATATSPIRACRSLTLVFVDLLSGEDQQIAKQSLLQCPAIGAILISRSLMGRSA